MYDVMEVLIMLIRVQYRDQRYDYVDAKLLDHIIATKPIMKFYRPSEGLWVDVERALVRGTGGEYGEYSGPERRLSHER
jgi:hypothetical protein